MPTPDRQQTIYLHIGRGKTGTTAIQHRFGLCRDALADIGVFYPAATGGARGVGHDIFGKMMLDAIPRWMKPPRDPEAEMAELAREIASARQPRILVSCDHLDLADPCRVRDFLAGCAPDAAIRTIYFVRSQDELLEAEYNQLVKLGRFTAPISVFAAVEFNGDFLATPRRWEAAFGAGTVDCRVYDAKAPRVTAQILDCMGLPEAETALPVPSARINSSLGYQALTAIRLWHRIGGDRKSPHLAWLRAHPIPDDPPALYFDAAGAAAFRDRFADTNRAFSARYLGRETPDLGGRRHDDAARDRLYAEIAALRLDRY